MKEEGRNWNWGRTAGYRQEIKGVGKTRNTKLFFKKVT